MSSDNPVPQEYLQKWQITLDLLAKILDVPAALIMRVWPEQLEVLVASVGQANPFRLSEMADLGTGLYCETVLATRRMLQVPNALEDPVWMHNPDLKVDMLNYMGVPLMWPDNSLFGTMCVLDTKSRRYEKLHQDLLWQLKELVEGGLCSVHNLHLLELQKTNLEREVLGRTAELRETTASLERELAERQRMEAQLIQSQKMECIGNLASGVAHDMNNVLGAILGLASFSIEVEAPGSPSRQAFSTIIKAAERGGTMVKKLLSFARQTTAEELELQLNSILREEIHLLEHTTLSKVRIQVDLASNLRPILGDAGALSHAFMNLCVNAVDAMPEKGTLTLRTRNVDRDWVEACVEDTGMGMTKEILAQAMDPFFTTKGAHEGTGLGLSMVYSTVKAHHGRIEIQSEPNQGTRVVMGFPAYAPDARPGQPVEKPPPIDTPKGLNVWVVDDDEFIRQSTGMILGALGHSVTLASTGEEALGKITAGVQPGLMILDWNMPGLGGEGTLPRLRALCPALPVLLATGRPDQSVLNLIAADAHTTLLPKPFSMATMKTEIAAAMSRIH